MTALLIAQTVTIESSKRVVILPRVCSWFLADFAHANKKTGNNAAVPVDCLRCIAHYIGFEHNAKLNELLLSGGTPTIKFKDYKVSENLSVFCNISPTSLNLTPVLPHLTPPPPPKSISLEVFHLCWMSIAIPDCAALWEEGESNIPPLRIDTSLLPCIELAVSVLPSGVIDLLGWPSWD